MGANINIEKKGTTFGENVGTIKVKGVNELRSCTVTDDEVHSLIDEIPILSLICSVSKGVSTINGISELRYKESDRVNGIKSILNKLGSDVDIVNDSLLIKGVNKLYYTNNHCNYGDHRLAMMISAAQILTGMRPTHQRCIDVSFPEFHKTIEQLLVDK